MDRKKLLPIPLPSASSLYANGNTKGKLSFVRRLAVCCVILAGLGLLYVPAYHSAQGQLSGLGETPSPVGSVSSARFMPSVAQLRGWSFNTSRDVSTYIYPENETAILNPKNICSEAPYLLIVVCSAVENMNSRLAIRNTWANRTYLDNMYNSSIKVVFLLGLSDNDTLNAYANEESSLYNDVIQETFHDTYNNLTLKSVTLLKWVSTFCNKSTYLMKTDDDMFVNVLALFKALKTRSKSNGTLIGSLICKARPITDPRNKWYTPKYMYAELTYPNYLSGTGYVMSIDVAKKLYKSALSTPLLHLEDVYITGLCAKRAGLKPVNHYGFSYVPRKIDGCSLREAITAHKINASSMYTAWNKFNEPLTKACIRRASAEKKAATSNRSNKHIGYFIVKSRVRNNRCI